MARNYDDKLVLCPYFVRQDTNRIHCEGWSPLSRTTVITAFDGPDDRKEFSRTFCCGNYQSCCLYCLNDMKYADD